MKPTIKTTESTRKPRMTPDELRGFRTQLKRSQSEMAEELETSPSTYQDWERGVSRIPGIVRVTMQLLLEKERWLDKYLDKLIDARLNRDFPKGIRSEIDVEE